MRCVSLENVGELRRNAHAFHTNVDAFRINEDAFHTNFMHAFRINEDASHTNFMHAFRINEDAFHTNFMHAFRINVDAFRRNLKLMRAHSPPPHITYRMYDCVLVEMFCQNCGTKVFDTGKFCHNCGVKQGMYSLHKSYIFIYSC